MSNQHRIEDLIPLFNGLFLDTLNTGLVAGDDEPIYLPASAEYPHHRVIFAHGFFASALHEIAHWCVAGPERRTLEDFGYCYKPDGRTQLEQQEFEQVEQRPQAYEWILSVSAGKRFHFSADNLSGGVGPSDRFKQSVADRAQQTIEQGMNPRLQAFSDKLREFYGQPELRAAQFELQPEPLACAAANFAERLSVCAASSV